MSLIPLARTYVTLVEIIWFGAAGEESDGSRDDGPSIREINTRRFLLVDRSAKNYGSEFDVRALQSSM